MTETGGSVMSGRETKRALYEHFARIAKAMANPSRIELLELLAQGERSVDALARASGLGVTTTSSHLQILRGARLVDARREGTRVIYRTAGDEVIALLATLRAVAEHRLAEVEQLMGAFLRDHNALDAITSDELAVRLARDDVLVLDVRPAEEFAAGHIDGAVSMPLSELGRRLAEIPSGREVVAYCRGPYCVLAPQAIEILAESGIRARRLLEGLPEWRLAGRPIATT